MAVPASSCKTTDARLRRDGRGGLSFVLRWGAWMTIHSGDRIRYARRDSFREASRIFRVDANEDHEHFG